MKDFTFLIIGVTMGAFLGVVVNHYMDYEKSFGATTARTTITNQWTFSATTTQNKPLIITTTNTATSTIIVGCFQFYATSTATPHNFLASTTPGIMYSSYGKCPSI